LTQEEVDVVAAFHQQFDKYSPPGGDEYDHKVISEDPSWLELCATARKACQALHGILTAPEDIREIHGVIEQDKCGRRGISHR